jgi:hypothetical protein
MTSNDDQRVPRTLRGRQVTVDHSSRYLCRHESLEGIRTHHVPAAHRVRAGLNGKRVPLCQEHADQWREFGYTASRPGPKEAHRRRPAHHTWTD